MKQYFAIAAVLGLIAFASVSFLAQAGQYPNNSVLAQNDVMEEGAEADDDGGISQEAFNPGSDEDDSTEDDTSEAQDLGVEE